MAKKINTKKQNVDLFGNPLDEAMNRLNERPVLLLTGESDSIKDCFNKLSFKYNKTDIEKISNGIRKAFTNFRICDKNNPSKSIQRMDKFFNKPYLKEDYTWAVAIVMGDEDNFKQYFDTFPQEIKLVWETCYRRFYANGNAINDLTGKNVIVKDSRFFRDSYSLNSDFLCGFILTNYYYNYHRDMQPYLYMPSFLWKTYHRAIADNETHPIDELKDDGLLITYSNEKNIGEQLLMLKQMQEQGMLEFGATKMAQTTIKKAAQQIGLQEFFPDTPSKDLKLMAAQMMIPSIASVSLGATKGDFNQFWDIIGLLARIPQFGAVAMEWISHLKSVKREDFLHHTHLSDALDNINGALKMMKPGKWLSIEDFDKLRRMVEDVEPDTMETVNSFFVNHGNQAHGDSGRRLRVDEIYEYITTPVCRGYLFMLATYGLLEVAYHVPMPSEPRYSCLEYIRLTKLGEYVFDLRDEYDAPGIHKPDEYFEMDTERLIIRAIDIDEKNPYEPLLLNVAEPIGGRRYKVTTESFMKGCEDIDDVERKWDFIKKSVCSEPSKLWVDFFNDRVRHCHPLLNAGVGYTVKKILPSDRELMGILTTDKYIREHILRAEKNHILIETKAMEKVKEKLRKYGYLL